MFGLFKKKIAPAEFGHWVLDYAHEFVAADAARSLGSRFKEVDASKGWIPFLERHGIPLELQKLYERLYTHCAMQAVASQFEGRIAREITLGAMRGFSIPVNGYDFNTTYESLEAAYRGHYRYSDLVEPLANADANLPFLRVPASGVLNAKYLIDSFVLPHMSNYLQFIYDFHAYSTTTCVTIGTVRKAMDQVARSHKIG